LPDFPIIIADESVDSRIVISLIVYGFRVFSICDESPGISDQRVIEIAVEKSGYISALVGVPHQQARAGKS
jgi:hypothetical protein